MSGLVGGLLAALSGAGNSIAKSANDYQQFQDQESAAKRKTADEQALAKMRIDLQVEASNRIAEANEKRANAPLARFSEVAKKFSGTEVLDQAKDAPSTTAPASPAADKFGSLVAAITGVESGGNPNAVSPQGASGSMQIMPDTFKQYAKPGENFDNDADRTAAAIRKLQDDFAHYKGDIAKTAAAYIGGRGAITSGGAIRGDVSDAIGTTPAAYAKKVLAKVGAAIEPAQPVPAEPAAPAKMRKMTTDEATQAALDELKINDPVAYKAAFDTLKGEHVLVGPSGALVNPVTNKVGYHNDAGEKIAQARIDAESAKQANAISAKDDQVDRQIAARERMFDMKMKSATDRATPDPKAVESTAQALAAYSEKPLAGRVRGTPFGVAVMDRVREIKPEWDEKKYGAMDKAVKAFSTGKEGSIARSLNVAIDHIGTAESLIDALKNNDINLVNSLGNRLGAQTGNTAPTDFNAVKHIVADEITKSVIGGPGALADREEMAKTISSSNSPEQIRSVLTQFKSLMRGQLDGLRDQYQRTTGYDDFDDTFLSQAAKAAMHGAGHSTSAASQKPAPPSTQAKQSTIQNPVAGGIPDGWSVKVH